MLLHLLAESDFDVSVNVKAQYKSAGADLGGGGGGGRTPTPQGFDPLPTQRVPPLILFQKSIFGRPTLNFF